MQLTHGPVTRQNGKTRMVFEIEFDDQCRPDDLLAAESKLQQRLNPAAVGVVGEMLACYDTHGEPWQNNRQTWTSKGKSPQTYQCYGGPVTMERHVHRSSGGGTTYCPMEDRAHLIAGATPHFASIVTGKYSAQSGRARRHQRSPVEAPSPTKRAVPAGPLPEFQPLGTVLATVRLLWIS